MDNAGEKRELVENWVRDNPDGTQAQCVRDTGVSKSYVSRIWDQIHPGRQKKNRGRAPKPDTPPDEPDTVPDHSDRVTVVLSPQDKQRLKIICAVEGLTVSEWAAGHIAEDYKDVVLPD